MSYDELQRHSAASVSGETMEMMHHHGPSSSSSMNNNNNNNNNNNKTPNSSMTAGFNSEQIACVCEALQQAGDMEVSLETSNYVRLARYLISK